MEPTGDHFASVGHLADLASLIGFPLALIGLLIALLQLRRTQGAVRAADRAQQRTERESALRQLLVLLPSLSQTEQALDFAVWRKDRALAQRELSSWRIRGREAKGMLATQPYATAKVEEDLATAIVQATGAKQRLDDESTDVLDATETARADIAAAVDGLTELTARLKTNIREEKETERWPKFQERFKRWLTYFGLKRKRDSATGKEEVPTPSSSSSTTPDP